MSVTSSGLDEICCYTGHYSFSLVSRLRKSDQMQVLLALNILRYPDGQLRIEWDAIGLS